MTSRQSCRLALTFALALLAPNLYAGEIVLYEGEDFQGNAVAFRDTVPNLDGTGFNDRAASISVRDGTWEVCFDAYFQGACMQLQPGDYPRLDPPFYRSISSVRPVWGADYGGTYTAAPPPQASLGFGIPGVSIGINLSSYPELVPVPGYPVYYAPQVNSNYFFYDGMYWAYEQDSWYASSWYNGPWGLVAAEAVPLFVLRVPVGYYRHPPTYFRGWRPDAPPRWGEHWGHAWTQSHRGWDNWNRNAAPAPAPLPAYQRQYSGNRYPAAAQQRALQSQNYRYQPQDAVVRQHYQTQQGVAPASRAQPPQRGGGEVQPAPAPTQQGAAPAPRAQPPHSISREVQRPAAPPPTQQGAAPVPRGQPPQSVSREVQRPAAPPPTQQGAAPVPRGQPPQSVSREVQRPAAPPPTQHGAAPVPRGQPPQSVSREVQRPAAPPPAQQGGPTAGQQRQQSRHAQEPRQGQTKEGEKGEQQGGEHSR